MVYYILLYGTLTDLIHCIRAMCLDRPMHNMALQQLTNIIYLSTVELGNQHIIYYNILWYIIYTVL